jgi:hypothetical protein
MLSRCYIQLPNPNLLCLSSLSLSPSLSLSRSVSSLSLLRSANHPPPFRHRSTLRIRRNCSPRAIPCAMPPPLVAAVESPRLFVGIDAGGPGSNPISRNTPSLAGGGGGTGAEGSARFVVRESALRILRRRKRASSSASARDCTCGGGRGSGRDTVGR